MIVIKKNNASTDNRDHFSSVRRRDMIDRVVDNDVLLSLAAVAVFAFVSFSNFSCQQGALVKNRSVERYYLPVHDPSTPSPDKYTYSYGGGFGR